MAEWPYNTKAWQNLRKEKLGASPLCEACQLRGKTAPAIAVDQIKPIKQGGHPFPALGGLMSLCVPCHSEKTGRHDRVQGGTHGRRFQGIGVDGSPIDPADAWHGGADHHEDRGGRDRRGESRADIISPTTNSEWVF